MPTIQFTYNKETNTYCLGFWVKGKFILRYKGNDRDAALQQFHEELARLQGEGIQC